MEKLVLLAIAICFFGFVSDVLPSVSAAHLACHTCGTNLLQTPQQCAESNEQRNCSNATACFAATAELANGTHIGIKDCYEWQGNCTQNTACMQGSNQTGVVFQRCYATCCTDVRCNTMLPSIANLTSSTTPQVSAAHLACQTCGTNLLQTPQQCAESNEQRNCSNAAAYFAATAELANGTHIGIKDCYEWQGNCTQNTACMQGSNQTGVVFQRCYATCCTDVRCNTMLPSIANLTSSTTPQGTTSTGTTGTSEPATTSGALSKDIFNRFFLFVTSVHLICFAY
ncbi:uncharacterized protein [Montipora foliosa]|uniref:uncharacterized protein n=1 Tax=Montipora foliosa TaxID=591990 RepID=UPI0035F18067